MRARLAALGLGCALLLAACAPGGSSPVSSPPGASVPEVPEDDSGWNVETHWDQLTPYHAPEQVARRYYEGYTDRLIPAGDYGPLYPFVGGELAGLDFFGVPVTSQRRGLMTADGRIVVDAVYDRAYANSWYSEATGEYGEGDFLILGRSVPDGSGWARIAYTFAARDGSWVTQEDRYTLIDEMAMPGGRPDRLMVLDQQTQDIVVLDGQGTEQYRWSWAQLGYGPDRESWWYSSVTTLWVGDECLVQSWPEGRRWYRAEEDGSLTALEGISDIRPGDRFPLPASSSQSSGLYGYMDRDGTFVIPPQFTQAEPFRLGAAPVRRQDGSWALIDGQGGQISALPDFQGLAQPDFDGAGVLYLTSGGPALWTGEGVELWQGWFYAAGWLYRPTDTGVELARPGQSLELDIGTPAGLSDASEDRFLLAGGTGTILADQSGAVLTRVQGGELYFVRSGSAEGEYLFLYDSAAQTSSLLDRDGNVCLTAAADETMSMSSPELVQFWDEYGWGYRRPSGEWVLRILRAGAMDDI